MSGKKRTASSNRWMLEHFDDHYVKLAQKRGLRSRAAFKLEELQQKDQLIRPGMTVVDLGAAPGGWSQVAVKLAGDKGKVIACDILPMDPLAGVAFLQGDFREDTVLHQLETMLEGKQVNLVISDMAPNLSGVGSADSARIQHVCDLALEFAVNHLKPDGALIVKAFHGSGFSQIVESFKRHFVRVVERKPKASRGKSSETFLVAQRLKS